MDNNNATDHPDHVTAVVPISFTVSMSTWALEYGLKDSEAREHFMDSLRHAVTEKAFSELIVAGWRAMDLADITASDPIPGFTAEEAAIVLRWWIRRTRDGEDV